jgi:AAA domain
VEYTSRSGRNANPPPYGNTLPCTGSNSRAPQGRRDSAKEGEADVVLISLVRNNSHATPAKALGFLRDNRRMNVLLSRAKWRLVLVGSLSFYRNVLQISKKLPDQDIGFLEQFLQALDEAVQAKEGTIVSYAKLMGGKP